MLFGSGFPELLLPIYFCLVDFDLFSYIDRTIYLVLYAFEVYSDYLVVFVYIRKYCLHFLKDGLPLKFGCFS